MTTDVRVGVGCFVINPDGRFVTGTRKGSHGAGCIQLPGGHLEVGESFEECAKREVSEECAIDLDLGAIEFVTVTNDIFPASDDHAVKHYVTIFVAVRIDHTVEPKVMEPDKCESWRWTSWADLVAIAKDEVKSESLFLPLRNLVRQRPAIEPTRTSKPA